MYARRFLPLFVLLLICLIIISYQVNRGRDLNPFHFISSPLYIMNSITTGVMETIREPFRMLSLRDKENKRLKEEIKRLLLERQNYREIFLENQRLREILSLKERERRYIATARVISRSLDPFNDTIVIDKGIRDGIRKDMAVITPLGLIGKVSAVDNSYSTVLLLGDTSFSAAVKIQETRKDAIVSGDGNRRCLLKYIGHEDLVKEGDIVITSGFDDLFPEGIPVGYITRVSKRKSGFFQVIEVTPFQDLTGLDEVIILKR
jgi:rod shape-determining protein MreC